MGGVFGISSEINSSEAIIWRFPVYSGSREPRRPDTYIPMGCRPAFHHLRMCQHVFTLYSALTIALDSDERWLEARTR